MDSKGSFRATKRHRILLVRMDGHYSMYDLSAVADLRAVI
jgi:hypothetical protein